MSRQRKLLLVLASVAILLLAVLGVLLATLDREALKERVEKRISASFGVQVRMQGSVELHLLPAPGVSFADIVIRDGKREVLTAKRIRAGVALVPLLRREIRLSSLTVDGPRLLIWRDRTGVFDFKGPKDAKSRLQVGRVSVRGGAVGFSDASGGTEATLEGLDLELDELRRDAAGRLSLAGEFHARRLRIGRVEMLDLGGTVATKGDVCRIEPLRAGLFGTEAKGSLSVDLGGTHPGWRGEFAAGKLSLADLSRALADRTLFEGTVEVRAAFSGEGRGRIVETLDGTVGIAGTDLIQHGFDLDGFIRRFRASRDVDLVDIGVYAFAGPVGTLISKGVDVAGMVWAAKHETRQAIEELVFNWSLKDGVARAEDVAFRTKENRLAFKGAIDLSRGRYDGMTLGLLNAEGCAELTEEISGPLSSPTVKKASMLRTLAGSLTSVLRKGWDIIDFRDCRPFYEGAVAHPRDGDKGSILPWPG